MIIWHEKPCAAIKLSEHSFYKSFSNKYALKNIFDDVIGLHYIDHIGAYILDNNSFADILSSRTSVEYTLFKENLFFLEEYFNTSCIHTSKVTLWDTITSSCKASHLKNLLAKKFALHSGLYTKISTQDYDVIFNFASKRKCAFDLISTQKQQDFIELSEFCLRKIFHLNILKNNEVLNMQEAQLHLIVNNSTVKRIK